MNNLPDTTALIGELVDNTCPCGNPGQLMPDPYDDNVNGRTTLVILCNRCADQAFLDS